MVFSSTVFLFLFLPAVLALYFLTPDRFKNSVLLACSLFFYAWGEKAFVLVMVATIVANYAYGLLIDRFRNDPEAMAWYEQRYLGEDPDFDALVALPDNTLGYQYATTSSTTA